MSQQAIDFTNRYDGPDYGPETEPEEAAKYSQQQEAIKNMLLDHVERSSLEICRALHLPETTRVDSRVRDLRKAKHGAWPIKCRRCEDGVYRYRMLERPAVVTDAMQGRTEE